MSNTEHVANMIKNAGKGGKFFTVIFEKKDKSMRKMNARLNVQKHLRGGELSFDPAKKGLMVVWDAQAEDYRMVNLETVTEVNGQKV